MKTHPFANCLPMLCEAELQRLAADIRANGLHHPILLFDGQVLDGRNRLAACAMAEVKPTFTEWRGTLEQARALVWSQNVIRRHLPVDQQGAVWVSLEEVEDSLQAKVRERAQAEAKQRREQTQGRPSASKPVQTVAPVSRDARKSRAVEAKAAGISHETLRQIRALPREQREAVAAGKTRLADIRRDNLRKERERRLVEISKSDAPLRADRRYPVLLADPPWRYEHIETESRAIENQYPTMSLDDICALPVRDIATNDAILFCWATSPKLAEAMRVLESWGFAYRTCAVWDKEKIGMGYYFRQQHELLLVATRGSIPAPPPDARVPSVIRAKRSERHSAKPVEVYEIIEAMYPTLPRLEMFCRAPRDGWATWGNQSA